MKCLSFFFVYYEATGYFFYQINCILTAIFITIYATRTDIGSFYLSLSYGSPSLLTLTHHHVIREMSPAKRVEREARKGTPPRVATVVVAMVTGLPPWDPVP